MPKVFISYARDGSHGERLAVESQQQLQAVGFAVFRDVTGLKPGDVWFHKLEGELRDSQIVVLVVSEKIRYSKWVHNECTMAEKLGIPIIPVLAEQLEVLPVWLLHLQVLDFSKGTNWRALQDAITGAIQHKPRIKLFSWGSLLGLKGNAAPQQIAPLSAGLPSVSAAPFWASDAGNDKYGRYADLTVEGVTQRFRWIEPGTFWMGSAESENGRYDWEVRHQVTLTKGFWLADTACTQALWNAVMDENPAHFQDNPNNPVEQVSWNDVQEFFLHRLNRMVSGLKARLPTEAEWEYACRAGTTGAFNFMGDLSLSKVNYTGRWDKAEWEKSGWGEKALQRAAPVKSYIPNHWGLYQMHGNVLEWCQDAWQKKLPAEPVTDPQGAGGDQAGVERVIRGGSWYSNGRGCRSACRFRNVPAFRSNSFGFRLLLGH